LAIETPIAIAGLPPKRTCVAGGSMVPRRIVAMSASLKLRLPALISVSPTA